MRWKSLQQFAENIFRKLCIKFHQSRPSFVEDITKKNILVFFSGHTVVLQLQQTRINIISLNVVASVKQKYAERIDSNCLISTTLL